MSGGVGAHPVLRGLLQDSDDDKAKKVLCDLLEQIAEQLVNNKVDERGEALRVVSGMCTVVNEPEDLTFGMVLGEGEFGRVWKGTWRSGDCAVKELRSNNTVRNKQARDTFTREIRQLQELRHANIVQYYGTQVRDDNLYLLTEYISGGCLVDWLHTQRNEAERIGVGYFLRMAEDVAVGLNVMHCAGFLHCDIAARNVLKADGCCKISDLGLSRRLPARATSVQIKVFPVRWSPPETIKCLTVSFASDVWAFGVFLWELFSYCAAVPYSDVPGNVLDAIATQRATLDQPRGCPDVVWDIVRQCLSPDRSERPSMSGVLYTIRTLKEDSLLSQSQVPQIDDYVDHTGFLAVTSIYKGASPADPILNFTSAAKPLTDDDMPTLAAALPHLFYTKISLRGNSIGNKGCMELAKAHANDCLHAIDLTNNKNITKEGREALVDSVSGPREFFVSVSEFGGCKLRPVPSAFAGVCFSPVNDSLMLAWEEVSDKVQLWDVTDGQMTMLLELQAEPYVREVAWDGKGERLAAACAAGGKSKHRPCVLVWSLYAESYENENKPWLIPSDTDYVNFRFHPVATELLLVFKSGNQLQIYHAPTKAKLYSYMTPTLPQKSIPSHVEIFSTGNGRPDVFIWGNKRKLTIHMLPVDAELGCMRMDADEARENWGAAVVIQTPHTTECCCVKIRPNCVELQFATCGNDDRVQMWDARGKKLWATKAPREYKGTRWLSFSQDGLVLYVTCGKAIVSVDPVTGRRLPTQFSPMHTGAIQRISLNATGTKLATCATDKTLALWHCAAVSSVKTKRETPLEVSHSETLTAVSTDSALYPYASPYAADYYEVGGSAPSSCSAASQ